MRGKKFDDLRHLHNGRAGDCGDTESFGDPKLQALCGRKVDVEDEFLIAVRTNEGDAEIADGGGQGVGERLKSGAKGVHCCEMGRKSTKGWE